MCIFLIQVFFTCGIEHRQKQNWLYTQVSEEEEESPEGTADGEPEALLGEQVHHGGEQEAEEEGFPPPPREHSLALTPWHHQPCPRLAAIATVVTWFSCIHHYLLGLLIFVMKFECNVNLCSLMKFRSVGISGSASILL